MGKKIEEFVNLETGEKIAIKPEELPPLRKGFVRVVHQTFKYDEDEDENGNYVEINMVNSFIKNGLVYNRERAGFDKGFSRYYDVTSMAVPYSEDGFWNSLVGRDEIMHKGADSIAIFDMPKEEYFAHSNGSAFLDGTISRKYLVGFIPNYGVKNVDGEVMALSKEEMEQAKKKSLSNKLPQLGDIDAHLNKIRKALDVGFRFYRLTISKYNLGNEFEKLYSDCLKGCLLDENARYDIETALQRFEEKNAKCEYLNNEIKRIWAHVPDALSGVKNKEEMLKKIRQPKNTNNYSLEELEKELDTVKSVVKAVVRDFVKGKKEQEFFIDSIDKGQYKQNPLNEVHRQNASFTDLKQEIPEIGYNKKVSMTNVFAMGAEKLEQKIEVETDTDVASNKQNDGR